MRLNKFLKTVPMKLYAILAAIVLLAFFSNDFGLVDIQKTAIILAVGIDKTEQGVALTSQIAVPKGSDRTTGGTSSVEIRTENATVSDCISDLQARTGWVPKLVFCNLILLGEEAAHEDVAEYLNYFLRNEYMSDSCLLAVCEGTAEEAISSQSALDDASSLAITKLFSDSSEKSGTVMKNTLKDFSIGYYGVSQSSYLPFIRTYVQEGAQGAQQSGGSGGGGQGEEQKIYGAEETAIFSAGRMVALLPKEQTLAFSMLKGNVYAGTFNTEEKGEIVTLTVLKDEGNVSLSMDGAPQAKLSLDVQVRLCCRGSAAPIEDVSTDRVPDEALKNAEETLRGYVADLFENCKKSGCDLFEFKRMLYRSSLRKYAEWKDTLLASLTAAVETRVTSLK